MGTKNDVDEWRFWQYVIRGTPDECWPWMGGVNSKGYGRWTSYSNGKRTYQAHRVAYELVVGPIPEGYEIDHVKARGCVLRACCNPAHLEAVTHRENTLRAAAPVVSVSASTPSSSSTNRRRLSTSAISASLRSR